MSEAFHALLLLYTIFSLFFTWFIGCRWATRKSREWIERRHQARLASLRAAQGASDGG